MMMTRAIATSEGGGGRSSERGGQREIVAPDLISQFKSRTGNLVALNAAQLFQ